MPGKYPKEYIQVSYSNWEPARKLSVRECGPNVGTWNRDLSQWQWDAWVMCDTRKVARRSLQKWTVNTV